MKFFVFLVFWKKTIRIFSRYLRYLKKIQFFLFGGEKNINDDDFFQEFLTKIIFLEKSSNSNEKRLTFSETLINWKSDTITLVESKKKVQKEFSCNLSHAKSKFEFSIRLNKIYLYWLQQKEEKKVDLKNTWIDILSKIKIYLWENSSVNYWDWIRRNW